MANKKLFIVCVASFLWLSGTLMAAVGMLNLGAPSGVQQERTSVDFPHSRHMTYSCDTCHHKWNYHAVVDSCTASGCHDLTTPPENAIQGGEYTAEGIRYYKYAYHVMCRDCHRDINARNRELLKTTNLSDEIELMRSGPVGCIECHPE